MTGRFRYDDEDEDSLFDSYPELDGAFDSEADGIPFYEDPDYLNKVIEEELGTPSKRRRTKKLTR